MSGMVRVAPPLSALTTRLSRLAPLGEADLAALHTGERETRHYRARSELEREGEPLRQHRAVLSGWAFRQRILIEGQRQILIFLLPGDLIGACRHTDPVAATTVLTATQVVTCRVPDPAPATPLAEAIARNAALEERYLMAQITRIGRFSAYERIVDWLLETADRLAMVGLAAPGGFALPLTQELLADTLGLTSVHVNRMLQSLRRDGLLTARAGTFVFPDRARLEKLVDYKRARVSTVD